MLIGSIEMGKIHSPSEYPRFDIKQYVEAPVLDVEECEVTPSLPLLSCPLWSRVIVLVKVPLTGQSKIFNHLLCLKWFNCVQTNEWC